MADDKIALFSGPEGLQEVFCEECGQSLGFQAAGTPVQSKMWPHPSCPERVARQLRMTRLGYDTAMTVTTASIVAAYPELNVDVRLLRAGMAAGAVLEALSAFFTLKENEG